MSREILNEKKFRCFTDVHYWNRIVIIQMVPVLLPRTLCILPCYFGNVSIKGNSNSHQQKGREMNFYAIFHRLKVQIAHNFPWITIVTRHFFHKQESPPAGICKRRTGRGITCPSLSIRAGVPPSSPSWAVPSSSCSQGVPHPVPSGGYTHPVPARGFHPVPARGYPI